MEQNQLLAFVMMLLVLLVGGWGSCLGCWKHERDALLQIKASFGYPTYLRSWGIDADCCKWPSVNCYSITGRVTELSLRGDYNIADFYLNASLFLPFKELERLDLSSNRILSFVETEGVDKLSRLNELKFLDLSYNSFGNNILSSLGSLSSLKELNLASNKLNGSINIQELNNLKNLTMLNLSWNKIRAFKSYDGDKDISRMINLKFLDLGFNLFHNDALLPIIEGFPALTYLGLGGNSLLGILNLTAFNVLGNLEELDLSVNQINEIVASIDLSKLKILHLEGLGSNVRLQSLKVIPNLRTLHLEGNNFDGPIFESSVNVLEELYLDESSINEKSLESLAAVLPSLKHLSLENLRGTIPIQGICNLKCLQALDLSYNNLDRTLPRCLANLTSLQVLDLSFNHLVGDISSSPLINLTNIQWLDLFVNHFRIPGSLHPFHNHSKLKHLDVRHNELYAETEVPDLAPKFQLQTLYLSGYGYNGSFPKFLYHQHDLLDCDFSDLQMRGKFPIWLIDNNTKLEYLDLSNNSLSGPLRLQGSATLKSLDVSYNHFHGHIPAEIGSYFPRLKYLELIGNSLSGSIPSSFGNMSFLSWLVLDGNELTGSIPNSMSNCSSLEIFSAQDNHLSGNIPSWFKNLSNIFILDISRNNFSGSLPSRFVPFRMLHLCLSRNRLQGSLENAFADHLPEIRLLDLSHNSFTGGIPERIGGFLELRCLLLSHNNLKGEIPIQLCKLESLNAFDVSHNNLYGRIPRCLGSDNEEGGLTAYSDILEKVEFTTKGRSYFYSLRSFPFVFDFSCNNFTGNIPPEFGKFNYIHSMNLSHNHLTGPIPQTFANLTQIEGLDLSYNNLKGVIPPQLIVLTFLSAFSVAHNNLSGRTPNPVAQFGTFEKRCYEENPFLCGWPLSNCSTDQSLSPAPTTLTEENEESGFTEMEVFWFSFGGAYIMVLLAIAVVMYINPYWRRAWLYYVELWMTDCYYFVLDNVSVLLSKFRF